MPRRSSSDASVLHLPIGLGQKPPPPPELSDEAASEWVKLVDQLSPAQLGPEVHHLITLIVRNICDDADNDAPTN